MRGLVKPNQPCYASRTNDRCDRPRLQL